MTVATKIEGVNTLAELNEFPDAVKGIVEVVEGNFILQATYEYDELVNEWVGCDCDYVPYDESMGNVGVNEVFLR